MLRNRATIESRRREEGDRESNKEEEEDSNIKIKL